MQLLPNFGASGQTVAQHGRDDVVRMEEKVVGMVVAVRVVAKLRCRTAPYVMRAERVVQAEQVRVGRGAKVVAKRAARNVHRCGCTLQNA